MDITKLSADIIAGYFIYSKVSIVFLTSGCALILYLILYQIPRQTLLFDVLEQLFLSCNPRKWCQYLLDQGAVLAKPETVFSGAAVWIKEELIE